MSARFLLRVVALVLLPLVTVASERAENLVSIEMGTIAPLPIGATIARVIAVDGRLVALGAASAWVLDEKKATWVRLGRFPEGRVIDVASDGRLGFLLSGPVGGTAPMWAERISLVAGKLAAQRLPPLPVAFTSAHGAVEDGVLHVVGTDAAGALHLLAISAALAQPAWTTRAVSAQYPGEVTSAVAQNSSVFVTLKRAAGEGDRMLRWEDGAGWMELRALPGTVIAGTARAIGQAHVLYLVDADSRADASRAAGDALAEPVPQLMAFHTITRSWATLARPPATGIRSGAGWKNGVLWMQSGADGTGAQVSFAQLRPSEFLIKIPDWIVIVVYLAGMTGIGLYFYLREKRLSTADFFVGSRAIPFWAAGVSLYATNTSSISYIAIPAKAFETNWQYLTNNLVAVLGLVFVAIWVVPLLRRLNLMSVFHYLEIRFHPAIRMVASGLCILVQIGSRLSVILFLPALAMATMTGLDVVWCIWIMGVITIAYTTLGGMKAVIWTDFVQLFVMFGGALFAIAFIVASLDGGLSQFFAATLPENKMKLLDFSFDLTEATVWGFVFLVFFDVVLTFPKDQVLMQRVLSTRSAREAGRSVWMFAAIMIPGGFMFYLIGTALYVFYQSHPERMNPLMSLDATFPLFIAAELPVGVTGLIIAGILAASMSTLSSILNSVATLASVDFYEKLVRNPNPATSVRFAEAMTVLVGLIGIGVAYLLSRYDIHSLFDVSIELAGLLGGGFAGAYTLGMLTRRANWQGVCIGIVAAITLTTLAWSIDLVHPYFYLAISILICIVVGYLASFLFPPPTQSLAGLTIYSDKPGAPSLATG